MKARDIIFGWPRGRSVSGPSYDNQWWHPLLPSFIFKPLDEDAVRLRLNDEENEEYHRQENEEYHRQQQEMTDTYRYYEGALWRRSVVSDEEKLRHLFPFPPSSYQIELLKRILLSFESLSGSGLTVERK